MEAASQQETPVGKRIYVGNLPYHAQSKDLEQFLSEADFQIERIDLSTDPFTGRNPSYCFIEFPSEDEAKRALSELNGVPFMGRTLKVNVHTPRRQGGTPSNERPQTRSFDRSWRPQLSETRNPQDGENADKSPYVGDRWQRDESQKPLNDPSEEGRRLYVGGLPQIPGQDVINDHMKTLFAGYTIEAVSKLISPHPSTQDKPGSHYYCFVDFASSEEAQSAAQAIDGKQTEWGGNYRINLARNKYSRKVDREPGQRRMESPAGTPTRDFGSSWRRGN